MLANFSSFVSNFVSKIICFRYSFSYIKKFIYVWQLIIAIFENFHAVLSILLTVFCMNYLFSLTYFSNFYFQKIDDINIEIVIQFNDGYPLLFKPSVYIRSPSVDSFNFNKNLREYIDKCPIGQPLANDIIFWVQDNIHRYKVGFHFNNLNRFMK